jgi:hypothetical protein
MVQPQSWEPWREAKDHALAYGSSTGISVIWLGLCGLILAFVFTILVEWLFRGRDVKALTASLRSWTSWAGTLLAFCAVWTGLYIYAFLKTVYVDHNSLATQLTTMTKDRDEWKAKAESPAGLPLPEDQTRIAWTQQPLKPGPAGYPAGTSDKPGTLAIITMQTAFSDPAFQAKCSAPCSLSTAMAIDSSTGLDMLPQPGPDLVRIRFTIPGRLEAGKQVTLDVRSRDANPITLLWVRPFLARVH